MLLQDQRIFLTGGSTGIGLHCARAYIAEGARVALFANDPDGLAGARREFGDAHVYVEGDLVNEEAVRAAIAAAVRDLGGLDAIHNNAGIASPSKPLHETSDDEWDQLLNVNLRAVLYTVRHGLEHLRKARGTILSTSSMVGIIGQSNHAAYTATKGGLNALTKSMAIDYAPFGIRVNAVCPAGVWTPMLRRWAAEQPEPESIARYLNDIHPLADCPEGDVVADACVFLLSPRARFITGHLMHVSGGAEIGYRR
ncbi:MAG: SDR family oxidoreductase [Opitutales bacterium]|nr:SDR family oxidoreductase [Opitutales bacterium]